MPPTPHGQPQPPKGPLSSDSVSTFAKPVTSPPWAHLEDKERLLRPRGPNTATRRLDAPCGAPKCLPKGPSLPGLLVKQIILSVLTLAPPLVGLGLVSGGWPTPGDGPGVPSVRIGHRPGAAMLPGAASRVSPSVGPPARTLLTPSDLQLWGAPVPAVAWIPHSHRSKCLSSLPWGPSKCHEPWSKARVEPNPKLALLRQRTMACCFPPSAGDRLGLRWSWEGTVGHETPRTAVWIC